MYRYFLFSLMFMAGSAYAEDPRGKSLHDASCMKCHDTGVYTRENRFIKDLAGLDKQVKRCQLNLGVQWFPEDTSAVVQYLNQSFYKFE